MGLPFKRNQRQGTEADVLPAAALGVERIRGRSLLGLRLPLRQHHPEGSVQFAAGRRALSDDQRRNPPQFSSGNFKLILKVFQSYKFLFVLATGPVLPLQRPVKKGLSAVQHPVSAGLSLRHPFEFPADGRAEQRQRGRPVQTGPGPRVGRHLRRQPIAELGGSRRPPRMPPPLDGRPIRRMRRRTVSGVAGRRRRPQLDTPHSEDFGRHRPRHRSRRIGPSGPPARTHAGQTQIADARTGHLVGRRRRVRRVGRPPTAGRRPLRFDRQNGRLQTRPRHGTKRRASDATRPGSAHQQRPLSSSFALVLRLERPSGADCLDQQLEQQRNRTRFERLLGGDHFCRPVSTGFS